MQDKQTKGTISWAELIGERIVVTGVVTLAGKGLEISYCPNSVNQEFLEALSAAGNQDDEDATQLAKVLEPVLANIDFKWNLRDDDDEMIPINEEWLRRIPIKALRAIIEAITAEFTPDPTGSLRSQDT